MQAKHGTVKSSPRRGDGNGHTVNTWLTPSLLGLQYQSIVDLRSYLQVQLNQLRINHQCHIDAPVWTYALYKLSACYKKDIGRVLQVAGIVITVTEAQNDIRRVLQVADIFFSAASGGTFNTAGASCAISIKLRICACWLDGFIKCFACILSARMLRRLLSGTGPIELTTIQVVKQHRRGLQHVVDLGRVYEHTCLSCCQICSDKTIHAAVPG